MAELLPFEETIHNESHTFDFSYLQSLSTKERSAWLTDYYSQIRELLMRRFKLINEQHPKLVSQAQRFPYLKEAHRAAVGMNYEVCRNQPIVHLFALFGLGRKDGSCHEVLFGEHKPVVLKGQTLGVLDSYLSAPVDVQLEVMQGLFAEPSHVNNPVYISYYRYEELAKLDGRNITQWLADFYYNSTWFRQVAGFKEEAMLPQQEVRSIKTLPVGASSLWWMALMVCPALDLSADYLFREDYSSIAVREDRELSSMERIFLSAYLSASRNAQRKCRYTLLQQMSRVEE